ncbi:MAG: FAD-dependent oxidoreductase [Firmicutes bacterium]|nr:FAD-dependent oxidoreductase [Bacillota bacterium]
MNKVDLVIIGGGPAGMGAAVAAYDAGVRDILVLERDHRLGGILEQCIHNGFGLHRFKEELTGPEYAWRFEKELHARGIAYRLNTMVLDITPDKVVTAMNSEEGVFQIQAGAVILAMGCRERPRGALNTAGTRPAGIYTAGTAQRYINIMGYMPGKKVVILGSGDIGLIMARRMTWEGAKVQMVLELMPYSGGLTRNIVQCLQDNNIPLLLSHTIVDIHGKDRVEGVTIAEVDERRQPKMETAQYVECDTILLSVGLLPENELSKKASVPLDPMTSGALVDQRRMTEVPGIFACGNVLHVHDLVDYVSEEAEIAGRGAAAYLGISGENYGAEDQAHITVKPAKGVRYTLPQRISAVEDTTVFFRVTDVHKAVKVVVKADGEVIQSRRRPRVAPGEMETVNLNAKTLADCTGKTLTIEIEEV